jgi:hypothetical protein
MLVDVFGGMVLYERKDIDLYETLCGSLIKVAF